MHDRLRGVPRLACAALVLAIGACANAGGDSTAPLLGAWQGRAVYRGAPLEFRVRFFREGGALRATLSSPDLLLLDQPLDSVRFRGTEVEFATPDEQPLHFRGALRNGVIRGGAPVPTVPGVVASRPDARDAGLSFELRRAAPAPAAPYGAREVRFAGSGGSLAGTLLSPAGRAHSAPGLVILQGSSSNLRREYAFYADHFARAGFAVLSFDKRGTGQSSGDYGAASYSQLADDGAAAVRFLSAQPEVDSQRVGVWGLSQGAFLAPLVAGRARGVAFVVAVSPPGVTIGESAAYQDSMRLTGHGFAREDAQHAAMLDREIAAWLRTGTGGQALEAALGRAAGTPWRRASSLPVRLPGSPEREGWYWRGRTLDPLPGWRALRVPVLVMYGAADELVPAALSARRIGQALREGGNRDANVVVYPAANHVLRRLPLVAGGKWDWPRAAPGYLAATTNWLLAHAR